MVAGPDGCDFVTAPTPSTALKKAYVPGGFRAALAVIDARCVLEKPDHCAPSVAILGEALTAGELPT